MSKRSRGKRLGLVGVRMDESDIVALGDEARRLGLSKSAAGNLAITDWLAALHKASGPKGKAHE